MISGSCLLRVGQQDVLKASHGSVVAAIKKCLSDSERNEGGPHVDLKISYSRMELLVHVPSSWACVQMIAHPHSTGAV